MPSYGYNYSTYTFIFPVDHDGYQSSVNITLPCNLHVPGIPVPLTRSDCLKQFNLA